MPHVRRSVLDHDRRTDRRRAGGRSKPSPASTASDDGSLAGPFTAVPFTDTMLAAHVEPGDDGNTGLRLEAAERRTRCRSSAGSSGSRRGSRPAARSSTWPHASTPRVDGRDPPPQPRRWPVVPPVPFTTEQAARLAALAVVAMVANFCGALLTQNGDAVTDTFHQSDARRSALALAIARIGVLVSLVVIALADRLGRRTAHPRSRWSARARRTSSPVSRRSFEVFTGRAALHPGVRERVPRRRRHRRGRRGAGGRPGIRHRHVRPRARASASRWR